MSRPLDLVVELIEAELRLRLRLADTASSRLPDTIGCCQAHRQSPILGFVESAREVRALCSAGITRPRHVGDMLRMYSYDPVRHPPSPPSHPASEARPRPVRASPDHPEHLDQRAVPTTPADRDGCTRRSLPHPTLAFPVIRAGRHPRHHFEACSASLRYAHGLLHRPRRPSSRGSTPGCRRGRCQLPDYRQPLGRPYLHGTRARGALNKVGAPGRRAVGCGSGLDHVDLDLPSAVARRSRCKCDESERAVTR